jgi:hypothetical protein
MMGPSETVRRRYRVTVRTTGHTGEKARSDRQSTALADAQRPAISEMSESEDWR